MEEKLMTLAYDVLAILIPVLVGLGIELLRRRLGVEKMERIQKELDAKKALALLAVQFVEQAYKELKGDEKYYQAAQWLADQARIRGLNITSGEIQGLIESALRMMKDEFGEQWARATE